MENLTYLQKVALKGEVAYTLSTSNHEEDIKFRIFFLLRDVEDAFRSDTLEIIKELSDLDDVILNQIYLEAVNHEVPVWLWVDKTIADLKLAFTLNDSRPTSMGKICIEKRDINKAIIESSFISFLRDCIMISPRASEKLCKQILECSELDFLHTACFYLLSGCEEMKFLNKEQDGVHPNILTQNFSIQELLNFNTEVKALQRINRAPKPEVSPINIQTVPISQNELSEFLSEKITELFNSGGTIGIGSKSFKNHKPKFFVRKTFNGTSQGTILKEFDSEDEAWAFKEKIEKEYPELKKTCTFEVLKESWN